MSLNKVMSHAKSSCSYYKINISSNGRMILPAKIRKQFNISDGDQVILEAGDDLKIVPVNDKLRQFQALVKQLNKNNISLTDKLKQTRAAEFNNE